MPSANDLYIGHAVLLGWSVLGNQYVIQLRVRRSKSEGPSIDADAL